MSAILKPLPVVPREPIVYPESDGKPMADNTLQFEWIQVLQGNLAALYRDEKVFVAGDLLWYPLENKPKVVNAPDVLLAFGRPKGHRGSYRQWLEDDVTPQVVFEVVSPSNGYAEMIDKQFFYEEYGVEEYYVYDPDKKYFVAHLRRGEMLRPVHVTKEFVSPRMKVRFDISSGELAVYYPDGRRFLTMEQLEAARAEAEKLATEASKRADDAARRARRLAELGRKARQGQATPEEIQELERLENEASA
jgi:Uma2 family endonuclease